MQSFRYRGVDYTMLCNWHLLHCYTVRQKLTRISQLVFDIRLPRSSCYRLNGLLLEYPLYMYASLVSARSALQFAIHTWVLTLQVVNIISTGQQFLNTINMS